MGPQIQTQTKPQTQAHQQQQQHHRTAALNSA